MKTYDALIVGAGPAGLGAAIQLAQLGGSPLVLDENNKPGGQLFKQIHKFFGSSAHYAGTRGNNIGTMLLRQAQELSIPVELDSRVWGIYPDGRLTAVRKEKSTLYHGKTILLATGASENALCFPGSTLPGVMTAGAAQTIANLSGVAPGKEILMVGSGNVGLIVAYQLLQAGAQVRMLIDAATSTGGYEVHAGKLRRAGVPIRLGYTILEARGDEQLEQAVIVQLKDGKPVAGTEELLTVDTICLAVGLAPRVELPAAAGCTLSWCPALGGQVPLHGQDLQTTVPGLYVAGDSAGAEEASTALDEGRMAGVAIAAQLGLIDEAHRKQLFEEIAQRLYDLRNGHFGLRRRQAKAELWEAKG